MAAAERGGASAPAASPRPPSRLSSSPRPSLPHTPTARPASHPAAPSMVIKVYIASSSGSTAVSGSREKLVPGGGRGGRPGRVGRGRGSRGPLTAPGAVRAVLRLPPTESGISSVIPHPSPCAGKAEPPLFGGFFVVLEVQF